MTKAEMEDAIRNLDARLVNVEQILPTLATKHHVDMRFEELRDDIRLLAEGIATLAVKLDRMDRHFAAMLALRRRGGI